MNAIQLPAIGDTFRVLSSPPLYKYVNVEIVDFVGPYAAGTQVKLARILKTGKLSKDTSYNVLLSDGHFAFPV